MANQIKIPSKRESQTHHGTGNVSLRMVEYVTEKDVKRKRDMHAVVGGVRRKVWSYAGAASMICLNIDRLETIANVGVRISGGRSLSHGGI